MRLILALTTVLFLFGCSKEDPAPQLRDPIYKSLMDQVSQTKNAYDAEVKKVEEGEKDLAKADLFTPERKIAQRAIDAAKLSSHRLLQQYEYLQIRAKRREVEARRSYKVAFRANQPWPDPAEFENYKTHEQLRLASRNWNERVPKLNDRIIAAWPKPDANNKKVKEEGKKEGHGEPSE